MYLTFFGKPINHGTTSLTGPDPANCGWSVISGRWLMSRAFLALVLLGIRQGQTGNGPYTVHTISQKCQAC